MKASLIYEEKWVNANDADRSIFSFIRKMPGTWKGAFLFVCNFTPMERPDVKSFEPLRQYAVRQQNAYQPWEVSPWQRS